jgi:hypothetical protein
MSTGPFLYDDDPMPLHTGVPRQRQGLLVALLGGTALVAVLMVVAMTMVKGSPADQAEEVAGVFAAALAAGDTETAFGLLCDDERARLEPAQLADAYLEAGTPQVTGSRDSGATGEDTARLVDVRWGEGATATTTALVVVPEGGTKICGTRAAG